MSAEDLGRRLLADVQEERLDELLSHLRVLHDPLSSCRLGIPQIDALLALFAGIQPPPVHQIRQIVPVDTWERLDTNDSVHGQTLIPAKQKAPPIVEITAPGPDNGKSQLLYYMIATSILPKTIGDISLEGHDAAVVVLDTESRFSVSRLAQVMRHYMHTRISSSTRDEVETKRPIPSTSDIESMIKEALNHVHIFRPSSLASLISTITHIPTYLFNSSAHASSNKHVAQIILDSASSFFWQDKADTETAALPPDTPGPYKNNPSTAAAAAAALTGPRKPQSGYVALASAVVKTSTTLNCPFVYTTWDLSSTGGAAAGFGTGQQGQGEAGMDPAVYIRPHLPSPWLTLPTLRLVVSRKAVRKFPAGITAVEAMGQKEAREKVVGGGVFEVRVNRWGEGDWTQRVVEGLRRQGGGGFEVTVSGLGVAVVVGA